MAKNKTINARIQHKHDIEDNWNKATGFYPLKGELIIYDPDDNYPNYRFKIGNGDNKTLVKDLPFTTGVGLFTAEGGEIFNDYENNLALAEFATAKGTEIIAGGIGASAEGQGFIASNKTISGISLASLGLTVASVNGTTITTEKNWLLETLLSNITSPNGYVLKITRAGEEAEVEEEEAEVEEEEAEVEEEEDVYPSTHTYTTEFEDYFYYEWQDWSAISSSQRDGNLVFLCVTDEIAHSGNHSFLLRHTDSSKTSNICLAQTFPSLEAGTYTLTFWAAGTDTSVNTKQYVTLSDPWKKYPMGMGSYKAVETDGIWSKYEIEMTATGTETTITIGTDGNTEGWYIDDISLTKKGTTENILKNSSFESYGAPEYTKDLNSYFYGWYHRDNVTQNRGTVFSCVTNKIAHSGNNSVLLKHEDSSQYGQDLKITQVVDLGEGTYTLSFWAAGTVGRQADDAWRYQQMVWLWGSNEEWSYISNMNIGETDGDWTHYSMDFTVESGKTVQELSISTRGYGTTGLYLDDISIVAKGTTNNLVKNGSFDFDGVAEYTTKYERYLVGWSRDDALTPDGNLTFSCVTDEIAHSGNKCLVLRHFDPTNVNNKVAVKQTGLGLKEGTYKLSFWAIEINTSTTTNHSVALAGDTWIQLYMQNCTPTETDGIWSKYELNFTVPAGKTESDILFITDGNTEGWYIDDISLVREGATENILQNSSFEEKADDRGYVLLPIKGGDPQIKGSIFSGGFYATLESYIIPNNVVAGDKITDLYLGVALGDYSHHEGSKNISLGLNTHTEGESTIAIGINSHTEGEGTIAEADNQHVQGKYNISDSEGKYANIVGNGTGEDEKDSSGNITKQNRSNAHTLDWDGNAWFAGDVTVGENDNKLAKIQTGSYVGTGSYGSSNPNSLTFNFKPQLVIIKPSKDHTVDLIAVQGCTECFTLTGGNNTYEINLDWGEKSISWYSLNSEAIQQNCIGVTYCYIAIG